MDKKKIIALLVLNDSSPLMIAKKLRVSKQAVYSTISQKDKSSRIQDAIAQAVNLPVSELWPTAPTLSDD